MLDFLLSHLGSIGLFLDMIGVSILFFVVIEIGEQVILADEKEESNRLAKKGKKENILKFGYGLIFFGFVLQLFSNEISNSSLNRLKCKIESNNGNGLTNTRTILDNIKGNWYIKNWTSYRDLIFSDKTVFVGYSGDTVFTLNYSLSHDTLLTWADRPNEKYRNKIITLTKDNLVLEGIREVAETRTYT